MKKMSQEKKKEEDFVEFHEFQLDSYQDLSGSHVSNNEGDNMNDFINFETLELDSQYRSISAAPQLSTEFNLATRELPPAGKGLLQSQSHSISSQGTTTSVRLDKPKATVTAPTVEVTPAPTRSKSSRPITAPSEPFYVAPSTHFVTKHNVGDVKALIEIEMNSHPCLSFEFFPSKCRWEGVFLEGSVRCKFEINVYKRSSSKGGGLVVEGNRISGDGFAFVNIYKAILTVFTPSSNGTETTSELPLPPPPKRAADVKAIKESITAVLSMASCGIGEAQLGASQILCNLASDMTMHSHLLASGAISALVGLMKVKFESCDQHAVCALAHLSSTPACREVMVCDEIFLQSLLPLCSDVNSSYNNIEMHRECARLLANIACGGEGNSSAQQLVTSAGEETVRSWLRSVDRLKDDRLRMHADRAKLSLASCCR